MEATRSESVRRWRIVLAEDQPLVRAGVRKVLEAEPDFDVVAEAEDGDGLLRAVREVEADVVVLDLNMPGRDGFEALREMRASAMRLKVLVLSLHADPQYVGRAVRDGADGYLLKDTAVQDLPRAVREVVAGRPYYSPRAQQALTEALRSGAEAEPYTLLTPRELEVLKRVAEGFSSKEIGAALNISPRTVETHRASIMRKLNLRSVAEVTRFAMEKGLIRSE
jgi:DNA-binding NarL/FixJ family response regulator